MAHHIFDVTYAPNDTVVSNPDCRTAVIFVGDTITFRCPHPLKIDWTANPFDKPGHSQNEVVRVLSAGTFSGDCTITLPSGEKRFGKKGGGLEGKTQSGDEDPTN